MARSISEIYQAIVSDKDQQASIQGLAPTADTEQQLLSDLNSTSKVAIWRLWAYITSVAIHTHEVLWDIFKSDVSRIADNAIVGTAKWYQDTVLKFQYGDDLEYDPATGRYRYATINDTLRIVKRCAIIEQSDSSLAIKVAKEDSGSPVALSLDEQIALAMYVKKVRFAGTKFTLTSGAGDILSVEASVWYDGIIPIAVIKQTVGDAITAYISNLPFNGEFLVSRLVDSIQIVAGVRDVVVIAVKRKLVPSDPYGVIGRIDVPVYGYYQIDTEAGNTLDDTLNFVAV